MLEDTFLQWHIYIFLASCCYAGWVSTVCGRSTSGSHSCSRNADNYVTLYKSDCKPHWKRPWCWERLKAGGEGDDRGWDGWMASPIQWTWLNSRSWWWTGRPGMLQSMGSQESDTTGQLNWTETTLVCSNTPKLKYFQFSCPLAGFQTCFVVPLILLNMNGSVMRSNQCGQPS